MCVLSNPSLLCTLAFLELLQQSLCIGIVAHLFISIISHLSIGVLCFLCLVVLQHFGPYDYKLHTMVEMEE
jgi:hypothetical protein